MDEFSESDREVFDSMARSFNLLMDAKHGTLDTPTTVEVSLPGHEAKARGSARNISDEIEDAGYTVEHRLIEEIDAPVSEARYSFEFTVTE